MAELRPTQRPKLDDTNTAMCIDPHGNLTLVVGPEKVKMRVDANALRRASKLLSTLLFGPFREAKQTADWTVELPEDDPEALEVILNAAHGNIGKIPLELKVDTLFQMAVTANKYLMVDALRGPLASPWTCLSGPGGLSKLDRGRTSYQDLQRLSVISYFGTKEDLKHILIGLICKTRTNSEGKLVFTTTVSSKEKDDDSDGDSDGDSDSDSESDSGTESEIDLKKHSERLESEWEEFAPLSQTVIDFVRTSRRRIITGLLRRLETLYQFYLSDNFVALNTRRCRATALGVMIRCLVKENLWPIPSGKATGMSIANVERITMNLRMNIENQVIGECKCDHSFKKLAACPIKLPQILGNKWRQHLENNLVGFDDLVSRLAAELDGKCKNGCLRI